MRTKIFNFKVRWLLVPLVLMTLGVGSTWSAATLPVDYTFTTNSSLPTGVTSSGLGSDYAASNAPYRLKFDSNGDYIQIEVDAAAAAITIGIKQYATTGPTFQIKGCATADGTYALINSNAFSPGQNKTATYTTNASIASTYRYFRIIKSAGGNASVGTLQITKAAVTCTVTPTVGTDLTSVSATATSITATVPISAIGGCNITENGLVYSTSNTTPTVGGTNCTKVTTTACGSTAANKEVTISDLTCGTTYYVRGYATNNAGTQYTTNTKTQATSACPTDNFIDMLQETSGYTSANPHTETGTYSTPTLTDKTTATTGTCKQTHYHFVGWITAAKYEAGTSIAAGDLQTPTSATGATYYAVWAAEGSGGGGDVTDVIDNSVTSSHLGSTGTSSWVSIWETDAMTSGAKYKIRSMGINGASNYALQFNANGYLFCSSAPSTGLKLKSITITTLATKSIGLYGSTSVYTDKATATSLGTLSATTSGDTYTLTSAQLANNYNCVGINGTASSTQIVSISITYSGGVSYEDYLAKCCDELGTINGSVSFANPTKAVLVWDAVAHVDSWTVKWKTGEGSYATTNVSGVRDTLSTKKTCVVTNLSCNTNYDFKIIANPASGYCDKEQEITNKNSGTWSVNSTVTNVTPVSAIPSTTCDGFSIVSMSPASGYHLPETITVSGASYTWNSSTGALTISSVTDNVTITIAGEENGCESYSFHSGGSDVWNTRAENKCFSLVSGTLWSVDYTIASYTHYCVNYQGGKYSTGGSHNVSFTTAAWADMKFWGRSFAVGLATGAKGKLKVYSDSYDTNLGIGFDPDGYGITYGGTGHAFATTATANMWETDVVELPNVSSTTYTMGLATATEGTYVTCSHSSADENINVMGMSSVEGGLRKIWLYSTADNWIGSNAKMAIWDATNSHWGNNTSETKFMTKVNDNLWYGYVPTDAETIILVRVNPAYADPAWDWGQSYDILPSDVNNYITMTGGYSNSKFEYTIGSTHPTTGMNGKFRMWDNSGDNNWHVHFVPYYKLTYNANGGSNAPATAYGNSESANNVTVNNGSGLNAPTGKHFVKWNTAANGTGDDIAAGSRTLTEDLEIFAIYDWTDYTVTVNKSGCASATVGSDKATAHYGETITLSADEPSGYAFVNWTTSDGVTFSPNASTKDATFTMPESNVTVQANYVQAHSVSWVVNGSPWSSGVNAGNSIVEDGQKIVSLPTAPTSTDCDDSKVFVGWRATAIDGTSASDPGGIFTNVAGSPEISANTTFYAVFADESGGDNTLITNVSELTAGTQVYIYAETADEPAFTAVAKAYDSEVSANNVRAVSGSVSNNKLTPSEGACLYTIGEVTVSAVKYYTFNDGTNYLRATGTDKNYLVGAAELGDDEKGLFSVSITAGVFSITCKNTSVRGVMQFNKNADTGDYTKALFACYSSASQTNVQLFKKTPYTYSNYVTSCASCDANATYTNTTPTVSDIDCTGATLTMEGGLATVGADGCHVSDYGFVIGTSDNPAVGGDGVTKLQVGTSDPTIGADFSYDVTGLTKGTRYYIRAYATNGNGTAYSTSTNFWTKNVSSIVITTAPTKTNYIVGETFDATGMVVTATLASGATEDVTSDVTYSTDPLTAGANKDFAINYTLCGTDKSVNQKINVYTLSVSKGTNPTYGSYTVDGAVITVSLEAQKTFSFATTNCSTRDNGDGTYTVINVTGNATVVINYRNAVQVKVYYRVDGTEVTGLTQDVYESSQTTLPTASALSSAMAAQGMELPDELYPNFIGWSETEFSAQTEEPTIVEGTPIINTSKSYYAVYSNVNKIRIDESDITSTSYPGSETTLTKSSKDFKYHYICKNSTYYLQFKKNSTQFGYIYNNTAISNIAKIEVGASGDNDFVPVYAGSAPNTISGSQLPDEDISEYKYVYLFPSNTQYFIIKGDNSYTYKVDYIDIFYASSTVYYMTQFCTRYNITGASTSGTAVLVNGSTGGTLTSSHNELCEGKSLTLSAAVNAQYNFGEWKIVKTGAEPEVDLTPSLLGANKTSLTPPAFSMPGYGITISATITEKTATAWSWTYNSAAIPNPMTLYVGEVKQLDVTYTPDAAQLVSAQKNYTVTKESSPVAEAGKAMNYYKMRGAAGVTEETNATVTFSLNSLVQEVNVTVKPLPSARFEDNVHNAISTTVTATVTDGVVSLTKKTPTHADIPVPASGNACEKTHLHLVGWIDGDWEPYINYINGGSRPSDSDITSATGYFYLPNADIDLSVKGGKTYYAVWGKADE